MTTPLDDLVRSIAVRWAGPPWEAPTGEGALLGEVEAALLAYPDAAVLHCMRGDLIQGMNHKSNSHKEIPLSWSGRPPLLDRHP